MRKRFVIESVLFIGFIAMFCFGCENKDIVVSVPVPVLTTDTITVITQTSAVADSKIESEGDAQMKSMGVCWSTAPVPTISDNKTTDSIGTGSYTSSLTGLSANTNRKLRSVILPYTFQLMEAIFSLVSFIRLPMLS